MSTICNYAVLRFQPYPDTGEFANLGIVMLCSNGQFLASIETRSYKRITQFFDKMDKTVFLQARRNFAREVERVHEVINAHRDDREVQLSIFKHLVAPKETMFQFGPPGTIAATNPEKTLEKLFMAYVNHDFGYKQDAEQQITQRINRLLKDFANRRYDKGTLNTGYYKVTFPFLWQHESVPCQAIKPISFDLDDPSSIIEKGDKWISKMDRLIEGNAAPKDAIFISRPPDVKQGPRLKVYREIVRELENKPNVRLLSADLSPEAMHKAIAKIPTMH